MTEPDRFEGDALRSIVAAQVTGTCDFPDPQRDGLLDQIRQRYGGSLQAVLIYGSYLRGKRDTLLDFYVFLDDYRSLKPFWHGWLAKALPPNVYQIQHGAPPEEVRAKYALLTLDRFERAVKCDFHSYFWARFAQPCGVVYCRDPQTERRVVDAIGQASSTFARRVAPRLPDQFEAKQLWVEGLSQTYQCEFRSEPPGHAAKLFDYWPDYYRAMTQAVSGDRSGFTAAKREGWFTNQCSARSRRWSPFEWGIRKLQGKVLSFLRIIKAALTFDGALDYLLWKIKRHSGVYIEPTALQRKYPLLFAWPLLFRLWRRGAFQ
ncbi:MAG: hypothetical protein HKN57_06050 [Xanthomonadales bacterium]|nr:hypothetical protein [Xanthomonadales bacterium]NNK50658.1 hypothetical protein [Xanthomonadales bacterium]